MGSSESKPAPPPTPPKQIPTTTPAAIPVREGPDVSVSTSSACLECASESCQDGKPCRLAVAPNKSTASVKIFRNRKVADSRTGQCSSFFDDFFKIGNTLTFREFALNLRQGKYSVGEGGKCIDVEASPQQFNELMKLGNDVKGDNQTFNASIKPNITKLRVREPKLSFLSENKLTIVPNVPFEMSYNGKTFSITKMALFHPSPVRIENVQHDAIITLNDPIDNPEFVVMIPLVSSSFVTESTAFFSRIGSAFSKVVLPNQEGEENVATGSDWSISKLFNTMSDGISVTDPFYTWTGVANNLKTGRYIVMEKPMFISAGELSELRNIPPVDSRYAIPSISDPVFYRKELCCKAKKSTSAPVRESFISRNTTPKEIIQWFLLTIFFVIGVAAGMTLVMEYPVAEKIRDGIVMFGEFFSKQFDKLYQGMPSIPGLPIQGLPIQQLDLKNLSASPSGDIPPGLQNLASNPAIQNLVSNAESKSSV